MRALHPAIRYMARALRLAERGLGKTSPNPTVGALVVSQGRVVGEGYHHAAGRPHAEVLALRQAGRRARGATLYVTLEPCSHLNKRTPPCVPAILQAGIRHVVVAMIDPNPAVRGKGVRELRRAGVSVTTGIGQSEAERLNRAYRHWVTTKRPYVILKAGMTVDGKIAAGSGKLRWITGPRARREAHQLRARVDAVLVGIGTVLKDDPQLTARQGSRLSRLAARQPLRIVVDSRLRIDPKARILKQQAQAPTLIATTAAAPRARRAALERIGIEVLPLPSADGRVDIRALVRRLGARGVTSLLVEGGGEINDAFLTARQVNEVRLYVAPLLLGGASAISLIGGPRRRRLAQAWPLHDMQTRWIGPDLVVEGRLGRSDKVQES